MYSVAVAFAEKYQPAVTICVGAEPLGNRLQFDVILLRKGDVRLPERLRGVAGSLFGEPKTVTVHEFE